MANFTLDYTGAEVNELLGQVAAGGSGGGGVMRVNVTTDGMDESMQFVSATADKSLDEIETFIVSGGYAYVSVDVMGQTMFVPMTMVTSGDDVTFATSMNGGALTVVIRNSDVIGGLTM